MISSIVSESSGCLQHSRLWRIYFIPAYNFPSFINHPNFLLSPPTHPNFSLIHSFPLSDAHSTISNGCPPLLCGLNQGLLCVFAMLMPTKAKPVAVLS